MDGIVLLPHLLSEWLPVYAEYVTLSFPYADILGGVTSNVNASFLQ